MTRRDLRPDETMDRLINLIYGDVDKFEEEEGAFLQKLNESFNLSNMKESIEQGQRRH